MRGAPRLGFIFFGLGFRVFLLGRSRALDQYGVRHASLLEHVLGFASELAPALRPSSASGPPVLRPLLLPPRQVSRSAGASAYGGGRRAPYLLSP